MLYLGMLVALTVRIPLQGVASQRGISHWLSSGLGSDSEPSLSWATSVNTLPLGSEIPSLHSKSEPNCVHTRGSGQAQLRLGSEISEPSPELSQCEMPQSASGIKQ